MFVIAPPRLLTMPATETNTTGEVSVTAAAAVLSLDTTGARQTTVEVRGWSKTYGDAGTGVVAVDDVDLAVHTGELVVLLGPSGCGKTTLLRCVAGLERPDAGEIAIGGRLVFSSRSNTHVPPEHRHL